MKRNLLLLLTLMILHSYTGFAHQPFCAGDTAYVAAISGLKLRMNPTKNAESILVMEFGSPVLVEELFEDRSGSSGWTKGIWVKLLYDGVQGFAFTGYLSPIPMSSPRLESRNFALTTLINDYIAQNYGLVRSSDTVKYHTGPDKYFHIKATETRDGVVVENHTFWTYDQTDVVLSNTRAMDAYHLIRSFITPYPEQEELLKDLIFIAGEDGAIAEVSSRYADRIEIKSKGGGNVHIQVKDFHSNP